jgi:hypothetical protein
VIVGQFAVPNLQPQSVFWPRNGYLVAHQELLGLVAHAHKEPKDTEPNDRRGAEGQTDTEPKIRIGDREVRPGPFRTSRREAERPSRTEFDSNTPAHGYV